MKRFSTMRDTQRESQSYMEKRRGRREIEVTRRKRGGIKRGESNLASNQFPMYSPRSGTLILKGTKLITNTKKQRLKI